MGGDGEFTMYVDLVEEVFAASSVSERQPIDSADIRELFRCVQLSQKTRETEGRDRPLSPRRKILRNAARCNHCGDVIESTYRHNFVTCSCGRVSVDGGLDYLRRCAESRDDYTDLSETAEPESEE